MNNLIYMYDLAPIHDSAKSFYGKAKVMRNDEGQIFLMSYSTIVAEINDQLVTKSSKKEAKVYGWYSLTTSRHINEFLQQFGFNKMNKKEMERGE